MHFYWNIGQSYGIIMQFYGIIGQNYGVIVHFQWIIGEFLGNYMIFCVRRSLVRMALF